ncbi:hypothetical protein [Bifidobacterium bifidum]|nr:hypothetical protein [Bifidobacterium bifidum]MDB1264355.1 hypothetical protein [Bifidobacterium bifidum]MDB1270426.1 hypothetical protein [Bifidobacterium bifidum]
MARRSLPVSRTSVQDRCLGGWRGRFAFALLLAAGVAVTVSRKRRA